MPVAYDDSGNQVIQKIYVNAVSVEQAGCFIKKRIRDKYGIPSAKITLNKKYLYVKNMNK